MGKILAAAVAVARSSVICLEPIKANGTKYKPGEKIDGLTQAQADQLVNMGHAEHVTDDEAGEGGGDDSGAPAGDAATGSAASVTTAPAKKTAKK